MNSKASLKKVKTETVINNYLDSETGALIDQQVEIKHHKIVVEDRKEFAFQYANIIGALKNLQGNDIKLLTYCSLKAAPNTNLISLTRPFCDDITQELDIPYQSIRNSADKLVKANILIKKGFATYRINPRYYWRGNSFERDKTLKYMLEIECPYC